MNTAARAPLDVDSREEGDSAKSPPRRAIAGVLLAVWLALTIARLTHSAPLKSANDRSRWCTVWSLVEEGTYRIDTIRLRPGWDTIDLVKHDGHFYSTKPPLLSTLVAGLYNLEKQSLGWTLDTRLIETAQLLLAVVNVLPMFVALVLLSRLLASAAQSAFTFAFVLAAACFATLLCPFTSALNNHTPAAVSVIFALCAAVPILSGQRTSRWRFMMAGFWAASACTFELPAAAFGVALFLLLFLKAKGRTLVWFVPAALIPLAAFFYTNYLATGTWKPFYLDYGTEKYEFIHNGIPSYWMNPRGIDRATDPPLVYLLHCTVGHHGILSLSPVFLLTLISWLLGRPWGQSPLKSLRWLGLGLTLLVFGFFMSKTENYNYGGVSVGLRWMLWLVPLWLLAMVPLLDAWRPGRLSRGFCLLLLMASTFSAWYPFDGPWRHPWLFDVLTRAGMIDYSDPPPSGQPPFQSWIRQVPDTVDNAPLPDYWIEFEGLDADGHVRRLRLADAGGVEVDGRRGRIIEVTETAESGATSTRRVSVDAAALAANASIDKVLLWPDGAPTDAERQAATEFLQGLPAPRPYAPGRIRYLGSRLRTEAFQTRHAASRVLGTPADHPRPTVHRRDLWLTPDVPFGILEFRDTIQDYRTGEVVHQSTMRATAAGRVATFDPDRLIFE